MISTSEDVLLLETPWKEVKLLKFSLYISYIYKTSLYFHLIQSFYWLETVKFSLKYSQLFYEQFLAIFFSLVSQGRSVC